MLVIPAFQREKSYAERRTSVSFTLPGRSVSSRRFQGVYSIALVLLMLSLAPDVTFCNMCVLCFLAFYSQTQPGPD